jgi:hypothetical protein
MAQGAGVRMKGTWFRVKGSGVRGEGEFRGGLIFQAHRLLYHSILGLRVVKKRRRRR